AVSATFDLATSGSWSIRNSAGVKIATGKNPKGNVGIVGFGVTSGTIIYLDQSEDDSVEHWFEVPLEGGTAQEILQDVSVRRTIFDNRKRTLSGYEIDADFPAYKLYDANHQKVIAATQKAFPGLTMSLVDWNDDFDR